MQVGVLALQGAVQEHIDMLNALNINGLSVRQVKLPEDMDGLDGLIIPGGESSVIGGLAADFGLVDAIQQSIQDDMPIFGTCAGLILLANKVDDNEGIIGGLGISVIRNFYGPQINSTIKELTVDWQLSDKKQVKGAFIRAPGIVDMNTDLKVLARDSSGLAVGVQQGNIIGTTFHPELVNEDCFHKLLIKLIEEKKGIIQPSTRSAFKL